MKKHLLVNLEEVQSNVRSFEHNPYLECMVVNPHKLTNEANEFLYQYRRWGSIYLDCKKEVNGVVLYYYRKKRCKI